MVPKDKALNIRCYRDLSRRLAVPENLIKEIASDFESFYSVEVKEISKKPNYFSLKPVPVKTKVRKIYHVKKPLAEVQKSINRLLDSVDISDSFMGGIKGKSIKDNAEKHVKAPYMANFDIQNFYPSIDRQVVITLFKSLGCSDPIAARLTRLTTADNHLPQGFNTSPKIAVLVLAEIDKDLTKILKKHSINHSFWVDDLTISGNRPLKKYERIIDKVFIEGGFKLHDKSSKRSFLSKKDRKECTGIIVNKGVNILKKRRKEIKNVLHICNKYGLENYMSQHQIPVSKKKCVEILGGRIAFISYINTSNEKYRDSFLALKKKERIS